MTGEPLAEEHEYLGTTLWSVPDFLLVFGVGILASIVASVIAVMVEGENLSVGAYGLIFIAQSGTGLAVMWMLSRGRGSRSLRKDFGLRLELADLWAVAAGVGLQIAVAFLSAPLDYFYQQVTDQSPPQQGVAQITAETSGLFATLTILVALVVMAPMVEEMMFRGMLLARAMRSVNRTMAIVVTAGVFALVHVALDWHAFLAVPGLFVIGVVLCLVSLRRGDLSLAIPIHAGVNLTAALLLLFGDRLINWLERMTETTGAVLRFLF